MEPKVQEKRIEEVLQSKLGLSDPVFYLEILPSGSVSGSIVSDSFIGMDDMERQHRIWDALDQEFGPDSSNVVGTLLAYSKAEWDWDSDQVSE